jgi:hypothetical protein
VSESNQGETNSQNKLTFGRKVWLIIFLSILQVVDPASMNKLASYFSELFGFNSTFGKGCYLGRRNHFYDAKLT